VVMRFDPFRELDRLTEQVAGTSRAPSMPMDAYRAGDRFVVHFDLPGVQADDIDLTVEKNVVTVRAERTPPSGEVEEVLVAERPQGVFTRQLFLGEMLDPGRVEADYTQGVLTLTIPVAEQAKPRRVQVSGSGGSSSIDAESRPG
jgi:HSP20 family protein